LLLLNPLLLLLNPLKLLLDQLLHSCVTRGW
jgi:hypothetical protein